MDRIGHQRGSPIAAINKSMRRITSVVIIGVIGYKVWAYRNYLSETTAKQTVPGAFTGETVDTAERKSKYEGAGNSYLGRKGGDRLQGFRWFF